MTSTNRPAGRRALALGVLIACFGIALLGSQITKSSAHAAKRAKPAEIDMKLQGKRLFFDGPKTVEAGAKLKVVNDTSPGKIGPHTFSLVDKSMLPKTKPQRQKCFNPGHSCLEIALWHGFKGDDKPLARNLVKAGKAGWDREGTLSKKGDSWFVAKHKGSLTQIVSAKAGTTLVYMCAVHPWMQGSIKVVKPGS